MRAQYTYKNSELLRISINRCVMDQILQSHTIFVILCATWNKFIL